MTLEPMVLNIRRHGRPAGSVLIDRSTKWGNRFAIGRDGTRDEVVEKYELWLPTQPRLMASLHELRGRDLVCWCKPKRCHGDVLLRLANA